MITYARHLYSRDPLDILIEKEASICKGCKHRTEWMVFGKPMEGCAKGRKKRNSKCYEETFGTTCQGGK